MFWIILSLLGVGGAAAFLANEGSGGRRALPAKAGNGKRRVVLCLGDSLTAGGYWKKIILDGVKVVGQGWVGKQIAMIIANAADLLTQESPTDVVLLAGVNNIAGGNSGKDTCAALAAAWAALRSTGARVWAVKLTPWYGYKFFGDAKMAAKLRAATEMVNAFITSKVGTPDGPDYVIDPSALADSAGKLRAGYSRDGLHMNGKGQEVLASIVQAALAQYRGSAEVGADVVADIPLPLRKVIGTLTDKLTRNGVPPKGARIVKNTVVFIYTDTTKAAKASDLLPMSLEVDAKMVRFATVTAATDDAEVGVVAGTPQDTPWTCGPAAFRAVLAHYGMNITEQEAALACCNMPIIGTRPDGILKGAAALGLEAGRVQLDAIADMVPLLAKEVPIIVLVDSFLKPGKQSHYCVVTDVTRDAVTIMDPHTPGNFRQLSLADFDKRWWNREPASGPGGSRIVSRTAIIIKPPADVDVDVGKDEAPPEHGRTANCKAPGGFWHWFGKIFSTAGRMAFKAAANYLSGGTYSKSGLGGLVDKVTTHTSKIDAGKFRDFINHESNDVVAAYGIGVVSKYVKDRLAKFDGKAKRFGDYKQTLVHSWTLPQLETASKLLELDDLPAALRLVWNVYFTTFKNCTSLHVLQAIAIILYGGKGVVPVLDALLKAKRPQVDGKPVSVDAWRDGIVRQLDAYRASITPPPAAAPPPATEE